jgi:hypothetical protein
MGHSVLCPYKIGTHENQDERDLDAAGGGVPDEFVELEAEADGEVVGEDPFDELLCLKALPLPFGIVEHWRKQDLANTLVEVMFLHELASELVVFAR